MERQERSEAARCSACPAVQAERVNRHRRVNTALLLTGMTVSELTSNWFRVCCTAVCCERCRARAHFGEASFWPKKGLALPACALPQPQQHFSDCSHRPCVCIAGLFEAGDQTASGIKSYNIDLPSTTSLHAHKRKREVAARECNIAGMPAATTSGRRPPPRRSAALVGVVLCVFASARGAAGAGGRLHDEDSLSRSGARWTSHAA